jgi:hypothetical protein
VKRIGATGSTEGLADIRSAMKEAFRSRSTDDWVTFLYEQPEIIWERIPGHEEVLGELGFSEQEVEAVSERCEQVRRDLLAGVGSELWE